jgi:hypothetical protein
VKKLLIAAALAITLVQGAALPGTATSNSEIVYRIGDNVTAEDESYVREGIRLAQEYLLDAFGVTVDGAIIVNVRATGAPANPGEIGEAGNGYIAYFTGAMGWKRFSPAFRVEVVVHEFVHVYQTHILGPESSDVPLWMIEGTAEYLASDALISRGLINPVDAEAYRYWTIAEAGLDELADYEPQGVFRQADARVYGLAYLGMAWLAREHGVASIGAFFEDVGDGAEWETAFKEAFGITPRGFYRAFEEERADYIQPVDPPDVYAEIAPLESASSVRITDRPDMIAPGEQLVLLARSEPHARCIAYLWGESLDLAHETTADAGADLFWLVTIPEQTPAQPAELSLDCGAGPIVTGIEIER